MRVRAVSGLFGVLALASTVAAPTAAAAALCSYDRHDLPVPAGVTGSKTGGSSADDSHVVGWSDQEGQYTRGLLWANGAVQELVAEQAHVWPKGVNNSGVVAGYEEVPHGAGPHTSMYRAFVHRNGVREYLQTAPTERSQAIGVNEAGDVVGFVWPDLWRPHRSIAVWPHTGGRTLIGEGEPLGITAGGDVVVTMHKRWLVDTDTDTGVRTELPGGVFAVLDDDHLLGHDHNGGNYRLDQRDLSGALIGTYAQGWHPFGRNSGGTVFGISQGPDASLWHGGVRTDVQNQSLPLEDFHGDVTDEGVLIGTYEGWDGFRAARWVKAC